MDSFAKLFELVYIGSISNHIRNDASDIFSINFLMTNAINEIDICKPAKKLEPKIVSGVDNIPTFVVKDYVEAFLKPLNYGISLIFKKFRIYRKELECVCY